MYFVIMPRVSLIVILVMYVRYLYSINCPTIICLPSMLLFILWRDTTSELRTSVQFPLCDLYVIVSFVSSWIGRCYHSDIMLLPCFIIVNSGDTSCRNVKVTSVRIMFVFLVNVSINCWCLLEPSSAFTVTVWDNLVWGHANFAECFVALCMISVRFPLENSLEWHSKVSIY
jgi:hypothetical protein